MSNSSTYQSLESTVIAQDKLHKYEQSLNYAQLQIQVKYWRNKLVSNDIITKIKLIDILGLLAIIAFITPLINIFSHIFTDEFKFAGVNPLSWLIFIILIIFRHILSKIIYEHQTTEYIFNHVDLVVASDYCTTHGYQSLVDAYSDSLKNYNNIKNIADNPSFAEYNNHELNYAYKHSNEGDSIHDLNLLVQDLRLKKQSEAITEAKLTESRANTEAHQAVSEYFRQKDNQN